MRNFKAIASIILTAMLTGCATQCPVGTIPMPIENQSGQFVELALLDARGKQLMSNIGVDAQSAMKINCMNWASKYRLSVGQKVTEFKLPHDDKTGMSIVIEPSGKPRLTKVQTL